MNYQNYLEVKDFKYEQYVEYLINKYGEVPGDYCSAGFSPNESIKRKQSDNLYIHHIREDKVAGLSDMKVAATAPFEYQQAKNLVYCNLLEHILLHIMIGEQNQGLGFGGAQIMIMQANDIYAEENEVLEELKVRCENGMAAYSTLLEHNMTLFYDLDETLMTSDRALVVLGTGLGKTTTGLAYLRKYGYKAIVLCPNNTIVQGWQDNPEVTAITYQKFMNSYMKEDYSKYQVLICDEAHHCTAARWGEGIRYILEKGLLKVIGLTATPKEKKDKKNFETTAEFFNHKVCQGYTVLDGIENGKIHDFSYVGAIYDTSGLREKYANIDDKTLLGELDLELNNTPTMDEILTKHMPDSKRKGIIFVSSIEAMDEAESIMRNLYPNMEYRRLHSLLPCEETENNRKWFQETDEGYLLAVNMISEGAHYKGVNTLIMFRRTQSSLVFNQQLGRIITLARDEDPHAIVFDLVNNANLIENTGDRFATSLKQAYKARKERGGKEKSDQIIIADYTEKISEVLERIRELTARKFWDVQSIQILKENYATADKEFLIALFKDKFSWEAIKDKARKLNLYRLYVSVFCLDKNYNIVKKYDKMSLVEEDGFNQNLVLTCCKGKTAQYQGYYWCYEKDYSEKWQPQKKEKKRQIICIETQEVFNSIAEAKNHYSGDIQATLAKKQKTAGGYHWCYLEDTAQILEFQNFIGKAPSVVGYDRQVRCITTQEVFPTAAAAVEKYPKANRTGIGRCCMGKQKTCGGMEWEYVK